MKTQLTTFIILITSITCFAQEPSIINPNDTNYFRIFNGIIIENNYAVKEFCSIQYISDKEKIADMGIQTTLPLMLLNIKSYPIEYKIDSVLYSRSSFIDSFHFSPTIQLPISINGKLLTYEDRQKILPAMVLSEIKEINYVDNKTAMRKYGVTP